MRLVVKSHHMTAKMTSDVVIKDEQLMQDMLYRIRQVRSVPDAIRDSLIEFRVDGVLLGQVRPNIAKLLCSCNIDTPSTIESNKSAFTMEWDDASKSFLTLTSNCGTTFESRSEAIASVTKQMRERGIVTGWRDELFPVTATFYSEPVFAMERAAVSFLGVLEYGVHIIGLVEQSSTITTVDDKPLQMWMARRSATKSKFPGMMDHIAAGGQPIGLSLTENVLKECYEEAGIPESIARKGLRSAGAVTYENYVPSKDVVVSHFVAMFHRTPTFHAYRLCFHQSKHSHFIPFRFQGTYRSFLFRFISTRQLSTQAGGWGSRTIPLV
jgi:Domain of unknown function (DUF4743)